MYRLSTREVLKAPKTCLRPLWCIGLNCLRKDLQDASLWNTLLLILQVRKSGSYMYPEVSLGKKVSDEKWQPSFKFRSYVLHDIILPGSVVMSSLG